MRLLDWLTSGSLLAASVAFTAGQTDSNHPGASGGIKAEVSFQFERPGLAVPRFSILLSEDGAVRYQAEQVAVPSSGGSMRGQEAKHVDEAVMLLPGTVTRIFKTARELGDFNLACASKAKNIADTGKKTLSYTGEDGRGVCSYNYTEDKKVAMLTDTFLGIAFTLDEGRRLEFLHRYDRLGLDAEMNLLAREVEAGRALELNTISPTLTAIAGDEAVMERVRLRAAKMLEQGKQSQTMRSQ